MKLIIGTNYRYHHHLNKKVNDETVEWTEIYLVKYLGDVGDIAPEFDIDHCGKHLFLSSYWHMNIGQQCPTTFLLCDFDLERLEVMDQ